MKENSANPTILLLLMIVVGLMIARLLVEWV